MDNRIWNLRIRCGLPESPFCLWFTAPTDWSLPSKSRLGFLFFGDARTVLYVVNALRYPLATLQNWAFCSQDQEPLFCSFFIVMYFFFFILTLFSSVSLFLASCPGSFTAVKKSFLTQWNTLKIIVILRFKASS